MGIIIDGQLISADDILGSQRTTIEAGEDISVGEVCYIKLNDGKAYVSDNGTQNDYRANGIAIAAVSSGADVTLITRGKIVTTGLTDKEVYYLAAQDAAVGGLLGVTTTQTSVKLGVANGTTELYIDIVQDDRDAIGTIKAVNLDLTGCPTLTAFWQLCDGTTISDTESPITGQTIKDINGSNQFLRGNDTSDTEDATPTHNHIWYNGNAANSGNDFITGSTSGVAGATTYNSAGSTVETPVNTGEADLVEGTFYTNKIEANPPYMDIVWVIKIK